MQKSIRPHPTKTDLKPLADEGCIIDVRPKPKSATKDLNGEHYLQVEYSALENARAILFEIPALADDEAELSTYQFDPGYKFSLKKGVNRLRLVHEGNKITIELIAADNTLKRATNDQPNLTPYNALDPIYHPMREPLEDYKVDNTLRRVVRIRVKGRGFESGFTLVGRGLLLQPSEVKVPPKP